MLDKKNLVKQEQNISSRKKYNPILKDFLDKNPDITIMGLFWAGNWRLSVAITFWYIIFVIVILLLSKLMQ